MSPAMHPEARRDRTRPHAAVRADGFTLLETLIALAIVAIALISALRAMGATVQSTAALREHTLASWVAQNRMATHRATTTWPAIGSYSGNAEQAGIRMRWEETVSGTPNALFRRIDVRVLDARGERTLANMSGYAVRPLR